ncbi:uncharacterized protein TRIREDRAFT_105816 [Trichoderma reesei QM6a]|jgi:pimeloyl-ACP methyl ester carboxylesterase|uniref:Predicted protein n=2 Tax=Hypocrea jecorina TaxID=51453 RepID=G0RG26_HYPJQ|nr:uncharacterized protein TRIREDRAFT_105816 [Trichoderma reesei QM6a]EGR49889.1 predicted protein [Trichoderma reesei QM6a]ETS03196.1 hypothetical protein M419DRAFT_128495 [Trichoderma reesei RUT C-30]
MYQRIFGVTLSLLAFTPTANSQSNKPLKWKECDPPSPYPNVQCAKHPVPYDWGSGLSQYTAMSVMRVKSRTEKPKGTIFLPSGPKRSGTRLLKQYLGENSSAAMELLDEYHIMGLDVRGISDQSPIKCNATRWNRRVPSMPKNLTQYNRMQQHWRKIAEECREMTGELLFDHMDTSTIGQDIENVRYNNWELPPKNRKMHMIGLSWGAQIGLAYVEKISAYMGNIVLDGITDHTQGPIGTIMAESAAFETTLKHFFDWCRAESSCALHSQPNLEHFFTELASKAENKPITAPNCKQDAGEHSCRPNVNLEEMMLNVQKYLASGPPGWSFLAESLLDASEGDASALSAHWFTCETDPTSTWASLLTGCQDWIPARDFLELLGTQRTLRILSPLTRGYTQSFLYYSRCISWPRKQKRVQNGQRPLLQEGKSIKPLLLVTSALDPISSAQGAISLRAQIPQAVLVYTNKTGHESYGARGDLTYIVNSVFRTDSFPQDGSVYQT